MLQESESIITRHSLKNWHTRPECLQRRKTFHEHSLSDEQSNLIRITKKIKTKRLTEGQKLLGEVYHFILTRAAELRQRKKEYEKLEMGASAETKEETANDC